MKGIYLTEEGKKEIEDKIADLETELNSESPFATENWKNWNRGEIAAYREILSLAIILPVEENWEQLEESLLYGLHDHMKLQNVIHIDYPNGVIIQPKQ
jgi:hypothetical protein